MGCCPTTDRPTSYGDASFEPEDDRTIADQEEALQYQQHKAALIVKCLQLNAEQGKVTPAKFHSIVEELRLNVKGIDEDESAMKTFYRKFKDNNRFDLLKLQILAILLGRGDFHEKATLFFQAASKGKEKMSLEDIQMMLETIFAISVDFLPLLAVQSNIRNRLSQKEYIEMTYFLGSQKEAVRDRISNLILEFGSEVSEEEFVGRFTEDETLKRIAYPQSVRKLLEAEATSNAAPSTSNR